MSANQPRGNNPYRCARGNCAQPLGGAHEQDSHNASKHMIPTVSGKHSPKGGEDATKKDMAGPHYAPNLQLPKGAY